MNRNYRKSSKGNCNTCVYESLEKRVLLATASFQNFNQAANGEFEIGINQTVPSEQYSDEQVLGWSTFSGQGSFNLVTTGSSGNLALSLDASSERLDSIFQNVETKEGASYLITFNLRGSNVDTPNSNDVRVIWNNSGAGLFTGSESWQRVGVIVDGANEGTTRLEFREFRDPNNLGGDGIGPLIDDVRVFEVKSRNHSNGSFERNVEEDREFYRSGNIPGWNSIKRFTGQNVIRIVDSTDRPNQHYLSLDASPLQKDGITSNIRTIPGQDYVLTFDVRADVVDSGVENQVRVRWNNEFAGVVEASNEWQTVSFFLPATELDRTRLVLREVVEDAAGTGAMIDNVSINEVIPVNATAAQVTPSNGSTDVNLDQEARVQFSRTIDPNTISGETIQVFSRGQRVDGRVVVSSTNQFATFFPDEPWPDASVVRVVVDGNGIRDLQGRPIDGNQDGSFGSSINNDFETLSFLFFEDTAVTGRVLQSNAVDAGGNPEDRPIEGVTLFVQGRPDVAAVTDANGEFTLTSPAGLPAGEFFAVIDGSTATGLEQGFAYPTLSKPFESVAGQTIPLQQDGKPFDIYLPLMDQNDIVALNPDEMTQVGFGNGGLATLEDLFPGIDPEVWERTQVNFAPGSAQDDQGNAATQAAIIPVAPDRIPAPLPAFLNPQLVISIQAGDDTGMNGAGGATQFDVPAEIAFPNLEGLAPGEQALIFSFDEDQGEFIVVGTGTVSADGLMIESDGGVIRAPGWHTTDPGTEPEEHPEEDCEGINSDDLAALVGRAFDEFKNLIRIGRIITAGQEVVEGISSLRDTVRSLRQQFEAGELGAAEVAVALAEIADTKNNFRTAWDELTQQNPINKIITGLTGILGLGEEILDRLETRGEDCYGTIGGIAIDIGQRIVDVSRDLLGNAEDLLKNVREVPLTAVCFAIDELNDVLDEINEGSNPPATPLPLSNGGRNDLDQRLIDNLQNVEDESELFVNAHELTINEFASNTSEQLDNFETITDDSFTPLLSSIRGYRGSFWRLDVGGNITVGRTESTGVFGLPVVAPDSSYLLQVYDVQLDVLAESTGITASSGQPTIIAPFSINILESASDSDGDELPNIAEEVVGTLATNADTDDDGILDKAELQQGTNPLDGTIAATGVVSAIEFNSVPTAIDVAGSDVFVTSGNTLSIVNNSQFDQPVIMSEVQLSGNATDVIVDDLREIAVVATGLGIDFINYSDSVAPTLLTTVSSFAQNLEMYNGFAYAASGSRITTIDVASQTVVGTLDLNINGNLSSWARNADKLYGFVSGSDEVVAIDLSQADAPRLIDQLAVNIASSDVGVFAGNGVLWVAGSGLRTIDISDPQNMQVIQTPSGGQFFSARRIALNGSGLAAVLPDGGDFVQIYDTSDPTNVASFLTQFDLGGDARDVKISRGIGYIAAGNRLEIFNPQPFDANGIAPQVTISTTVADFDPSTEGIQVLEGTTIPVIASTLDDVQVRDVELIVNENVVAQDVSFPFDLSVIAPLLSTGQNQLDIQVRATDTGGNSSLSEVLTIDVVPDTIPPTIVSISPENNGQVLEGNRVFRIRFDEPLSEESIRNNVFRVVDAGPDGLFATGDEVNLPISVELRDNDQLVQIEVEDLQPGLHRIAIQQRRISDRAGNVLADDPLSVRFQVVEATPIFQGLNPDILFVFDVSGSTSDLFQGTPVGDINGDGDANEILDAELAWLTVLNQEIINLGLPANVGLVPFGSSGVALDLDPFTEGDQFLIPPDADLDGSGQRDIVEILATADQGAFGAGSGGTNFESALRRTIEIFESAGTPFGEGNIVFLSDGASGSASFTDEVAQLTDELGVNIRAFGVGAGASLDQLMELDPLATLLESTDDFIEFILTGGNI